MWLRSRGNDPNHVERVGGMVVETDSVRETEKMLLGTWGGRRKPDSGQAKAFSSQWQRVSLEEGSIDDLFVCC